MKQNKGFSLIELSIVILIIGILIAGVTTGSNLIKKSRIVTARSLTKSSPVLSIKDLSLWLESTEESNFKNDTISDGDSITDWINVNRQISSPEVNDISQITSAHQPSYSDEGINGIPAVYFDGVDDHLEKSSMAMESLISSDEASIFMVIKQEQLSTVLANIFEFYAPGFGNMLLYTGYSANSFTSRFAGEIFSSTIGASFNQKPSIIYMSRENSVSTIVINGTTYSSGTSAVSNRSHGSYHLNIGRSYDTRYVFKGMIGEIIVYDRGLKEKERVAISEYLSQKWGIITE